MAASNGLPRFLAQAVSNGQEFFGFAAASDPMKSTLGVPWRVQTITPAALNANPNPKSISAIVTPTSLWYFPVTNGGEFRAVLVVDQVEGRWEAVSLGYAKLAQEWTGVNNQWPVSKGYHPMLIAVFQAKQFYFTVPEVSDSNLTPVPSTGSSKSSSFTSTLGSVDDAAKKLAPILSKSLQQ